MTIHHIRTPAFIALSLALVCQLGCSKPPGPAGENEDALLKTGLEALYTRHDPQAAVTTFRKVLELNPTHYGATYQLASALDATGKRDEARALWEKMLRMAEAAHDQPTIDTVRARLRATP
jgi:cytochrome c-type biogenesis protein CcmH/NrfG